MRSLVQYLALSVLLFTIAAPGSTLSQQRLSTATKVDEWKYLKTEDEMARLDLFAEKLVKDQSLTGLIAGYQPTDWRIGSRFRDLYGYYDYLVNKRGVRPEQIRVELAGVRDAYLTELWLVPPGSVAPVGTTNLKLDLGTPVLFDDLYLGPDCLSEVSIVLEEPDDAVRFFADALRANAGARGYVLIHPSEREASANRRKLEASMKQSLVKHSVSFDQATIGFEGSRHCSQVDFWIVPQHFKPVAGLSFELSIQSELMAYAEKNQHTVRRVEFVGNKYTRDNTVRRRIPGVQEGNIFSTAVLKRDLTSLSRVKSIKPVRLQDVEVGLNNAERTIDLFIFVTDLSRGPR